MDIAVKVTGKASGKLNVVLSRPMEVIKITDA